MQYTDQLATDPLTFTCYMAEDGLASYILYEDDGSTLAYQNGAFARTSINCHVSGDLSEVEIEEHFVGYHPKREWYQVIVQVGGRTLQQRVKASQGKIVVRL
jgi:alpha-glucosidase